MSARLVAFATVLIWTTACVATEPPQPSVSRAQSEAARAVPLASSFLSQDDAVNARLAWAVACEDWDDWDKPAPPFPVFGDDTWYVGTCGIAAILVTTVDGLVLLDSGTETGAQIVLENIRTLGFDPQDVAYILTSHEHFDHVGGVAEIQRMTGARLITSAPAAAAFSSGEVATDDPQFGVIDGVSPAIVHRIVGDGDVVEIGNKRFTVIATPGHTPGALSWTWDSLQGWDNLYTVVYADSLSPVSGDLYRFSDHPEYVAAYREGLVRLANIGRCILLTPHPSASGMREKALNGSSMVGGRSDCADYAADRLERLEARLATEAQEAAQ